MYFLIYTSMFIFFLINIVLHPGSSIRAAHSSNHHNLALESDTELFDEVLKPLQNLQLVPHAMVWTLMMILQ